MDIQQVGKRAVFSCSLFSGLYSALETSDEEEAARHTKPTGDRYVRKNTPWNQRIRGMEILCKVFDLKT
jgi:hypothetical protein